MSMLSEPRQRKRYNLVPRGKALYEDEGRFGTKMLEKMGWQKGKGLGANEDGSKEFVRIRYKNDILGLGFEHRDDQWTQHEQSFSGLLKTLNNEDHEGSEIKLENEHNCEDVMPRAGFGFQASAAEDQKNHKVEKLKEKISGVSLEERSKQSRARVHYKKFTKGKDLAQYSEKDLANIFGKKASDEHHGANNFYQQLSNSFSKKQEDTNNGMEEEEPINGFQIINTGVSVNDYFKNKIKVLTTQRNECGKDNGSNDAYIVNNERKSEKMSIKRKEKFKNNVNVEEAKANKTETKDGNMIYSEISVTDYFKIKMKAIKNRKNTLNDAQAMDHGISLYHAMDNITTTDAVQEEDITKKKKKNEKDKENVDELKDSLHNEKEIDDHEAVFKEVIKSKKRDVETKEVFLEKGTKAKKKKDKTKTKDHEVIELHSEINTDLLNKNLTIKKRKHEDLSTFKTTSLDTTEPIELDLAQELAIKKHKKNKSKESTEAIEIYDNCEKKTKTSSKNKLNIEKKRKSEKFEESSDNSEKEEIFTKSNETEVSSEQTSKNTPKKSKSKKYVSSTAKHVLKSDVNTQLLDLDELKQKYTSFNIYPISTFCAEKFRNTSLNDFTGSVLPQINGYGLGPDLQLDVQIIKNDEERITNLWKCALNKYVHLEKPKKTYQHYVREMIKARKTKQKRPKLYVKTWKRKNAFQVI